MADQGVLEVTLLGQNVNAYGVSFATDERLREDSTTWAEIPRDRGAFAKLLRACGRIDGLERVRFTSPHPAEFTDDVIEAMAETPNVCPTLHMPLQSGSDRILKAMRRSYRAERYLGIVDRVRSAIPHAAITTDLIVGFPGETEEDFQATLDVVEAARFATAFTFQYSKRPGTPAAELPDQLPKDVVQERYHASDRAAGADLLGRERRSDRVDGRAARRHRRRPQGLEHRQDVRTGPRRQAGALRPGGAHIRPGDVVTTTVTGAAPHHLDRRFRHRRSPTHPRRRRPRGRCVKREHRRRAGHARDRRAAPPRTGGQGVLRVTGAADRNDAGFDEFKADIEDAEKRVAREIDPGARALVVASLVFVILATFVLPHTGHARGFDVLVGDDAAVREAIALPSRVFTWLTLVFSVGFSILALLTRRWGVAWIALAGSAVACPIGMLAVWSRQTVAHPHPGPGIGLIVAWIAVILLTFHWARVVWSRTAVQLAAEEERRRLAVERQGKSLLDDPGD